MSGRKLYSIKKCVYNIKTENFQRKKFNTVNHLDYNVYVSIAFIEWFRKIIMISNTK